MHVRRTFLLERSRVQISSLFIGVALSAGPLAAAAGAQSSPVGTVAGRVTDLEGEPLPAVTITVTGTPNGAVTKGDGTYRLQLLPGRYELGCAASATRRRPARS
jgi:hypothetical protein